MVNDQNIIKTEVTNIINKFIKYPIDNKRKYDNILVYKLLIKKKKNNYRYNSKEYYGDFEIF